MTISMQTVISNMRRLKSKGVTYSMLGSRTGADGTADCSGAVYDSLNSAGANLPPGNTDTLFKDLPKIGFSKTSAPYQYGDIFIFGIEGQSGGEAGHTGIFLDKETIIHCNSRANGVSMDNFNTVLSSDGNPPHTVYRLLSESGNPPKPTKDATTETNTEENFINTGEIEEYSYIGATLCVKGWHFASKLPDDSGDGGDNGSGGSGGNGGDGGSGGGGNPSGPYENGDITNAGFIFSSANLNLLLKYASQRNIKPSFMVAQLFIESHWGDPNTSLTGAQDNNWAGISMPFNPPSGVTVTQGTPRPSNEGGYYVKFATLDDFFNSYCFVLSKANGLYNVEGKTTLEEYVRGLFRVGGANADYAAAGFDHYWNLMQPTYNAILSQNPGKLEKLDSLVSSNKRQVRASSGWGWPFSKPYDGSYEDGQQFGMTGYYRPGGTYFHDGFDFGSARYSGDILAVHDGEVIYTGTPGSGLGAVIVLSVPPYQVMYQEFSESLAQVHVKVGDKVTKGQKIATLVSSHLHLGITKKNWQEALASWDKDDGTWLDPIKIIQEGASTGGDGGSGGDSGDGSGGGDGGGNGGGSTPEEVTSHEVMEIYDATNDKKVRSIDVPPMKRPDIAEQNPDVKGIEWSGIEGCIEFEYPNPFYIQFVRVFSDGTRKVLHLQVLFFPHSSSRTDIGHDYCQDDYFMIICTDKNGKSQYVNDVLGGIAYSFAANEIPSCTFRIPITEASKFDGHMDCKIIIYKQMFDGIVKDIQLNKDDETATISLDHKIAEWEYRQIPNNYTVKNQTFPSVFCQSPFLFSTDWYIDVDDVGHKEKINYAFSRQSHLEALNKAVELTENLWWRVGTRYDRYLEIGAFGEKKNYIISERGQTDRHLKIIDAVNISRQFDQVFNIVTAYGEKSDSSQASLTLREAYLAQQQQGHDIIKGFPIVILNPTANREQKNYYTNITKVASNNSLEFSVLDEFSINLEQGKLIERTISMNDIAPFEENGETISDEERAKQAMIAYKAAVRQLKNARRREVIQVRVGKLPCDLNVLDRVYFDYHNCVQLFDHCSRYCQKIYEASDDFYILQIDKTFDENLVETNVLTLSKELHKDDSNY